tara:strand:+ start:37129 stop:38073 length:945 start_codon:yes stop_codon:yes gene_type:complete
MKSKTYLSYYNPERFKFYHKNLLNDDRIKYTGSEIILKTATFVGNEKNVYIDTSDGVNDDLEIFEYCGRVRNVVEHSQGKPFVYLKSAYSNKWSKNIVDYAQRNNGFVVPFFKWSFNSNFYNYVYEKKKQIKEKYDSIEKKYDVGVFFSDKKYHYPKASSVLPDISHTDHDTFNIPGRSKNTGYYDNNSRQNLISKLRKSNLKVLHTSCSYEDYIKHSFECKVIINPPGIGEYTSRMVDQSYLGNCIVMRKNSYDNAHSWKKHIPEIDFNSVNWENDLSEIVQNYPKYQQQCEEYYKLYWTPEAICKYLNRYLD